MAKLDPALFLRAAESVETDDSVSGCCQAIFREERQLPDCRHENFFDRWFRPVHGVDYRHDAEDYDAYWFNMGATRDEAKDARVLALCMAATLAADRSLPSGRNDP